LCLFFFSTPSDAMAMDFFFFFGGGEARLGAGDSCLQ
jgi:hypothetical protein